MWLGEYEHSRRTYCFCLWDEDWSSFPLTVGNHLLDCMSSCPIRMQNFCMSLTKSFKLWHYLVWLGEYEHSRRTYCFYLRDEDWSSFPLTVGNHLPDCMSSCPIRMQNFCMSLTKYLQFTYFSLSCYKKMSNRSFSWNTQFITVFTWNQPMDQMLSHSNPFHIFTVYFFSIHFHILFLLMSVC